MSEKLNILLVEDYFVDEIAVSRILKKGNVSFSLTRVETKADYIQELSNNKYDLILSDYYLPEFNGLEALNILQRTEQDTPFIIVSGLIGEENAIELMRCGANDYVMKGDLRRLPEAIKRAVREAKSRKSRYEAHTQLIESHKINQAIFSALPDLIYLVDRHLNIIRQISNPSDSHSIYNDQDDSSISLLLDKVDHGKFLYNIARAIESKSIQVITESLVIHNSNKTFEIKFSPVNQDHVIMIFRDITKEKQAQEQLIFSAYHDPLTGLANRKKLNERLHLLLSRLKRFSHASFGVLYLDFDRFKSINDTYGHKVGDEVLIHIANVLLDNTRVVDICSRLGGDEFFIVLEDVSQQEEVFEVAERILASFLPSVNINNIPVQTSPSIGIYWVDQANITCSEILRNADMAMYEAKRKGGNAYVLFDETLYKNTLHQRSVEMGIQSGLTQNEFELYYQPIVKLNSLKCVGFECLLRWNHPIHGLIQPNDFLEIAEQSDLICKLDAWVIQTACHQWNHWHTSQMLNQYPTLGINLSPKTLNDPNVCKLIQSILKTEGVDPNYINFEITESLLIQNFEQSEQIVQALKELGLSISLDDFGTGYSALNYLPKLSIDQLKIDKSFTQKIGTNEKYFNIVSTIFDLSRQLNMEVIVEGIEKNSQLQILVELGCQQGQGFLFAPPLPSDEVLDFLDTTLLLPSA